MKPSRLALLAAVIGLVSCGRVADLQPPPGHKLPVKPEMARTTPTAKELLAIPTYARPDRVDELVRRSEPRPADPFNLPPPTGGAAAPAQPAGMEPAPATNNTSVSNPGA